MKCTNPAKCDGEMKTYEGIEGSVECVTCGYRIPEPKDTKKEVKTKVSTKEGENN